MIGMAKEADINTAESERGDIYKQVHPTCKVFSVGVRIQISQ